MKKKKIMMNIIAFAAIISFFWDLIVPVRSHGRAANLVEDYWGYYLTASWQQGWFNFGLGNSWSRNMRFLPGQKPLMINKMKKDIVNELETLVEENGDVCYKYEISDDFIGVRIYIASGDVDLDKLYDIRREMREELGALIELYHTVKAGHPGSQSDVKGYGIFFVEPDG